MVDQALAFDRAVAINVVANADDGLLAGLNLGV